MKTIGRPRVDVLERFTKYTERKGECLLWVGAKTGNGYGTMSVEGKYVPTHRISYLLFKGEIEKGKIVCHTCDTPLCVEPKHLWLGSIKENTLDCVSKGRHKTLKGDANKLTKISDADVKNIRNFYNIDKISQNKIALMYNVSQSTISLIVRNIKRKV